VIEPLDVVLVDGKPGDRIACSDRGLQYGDGLFETVSCLGGKPRWLALHLDRLRKGLARLRLPFREFDALQAEIESMAAGAPRCLVKVIVTRGTATRRGYAPVGDEQPTRIVSRHPWPPDAQASGYRIGISDICLGSNPALAGLKHLNRLEQVLAQMDLAQSGVNEVLMWSTTGHLIGGSMSNVFLADDHGMLTPELHECGVEGVMRRVVLECAAATGMSVQVRPIVREDLAAAPEVFVTNIRLGVQSVSWLDGRTLTSDSYAQQLRRRIDATHC